MFNSANAEKLQVGFDPDGNQIDKRILFEVAGVKLSPDDFKDDQDSFELSDSDEDSSNGGLFSPSNSTKLLNKGPRISIADSDSDE